MYGHATAAKVSAQALHKPAGKVLVVARPEHSASFDQGHRVHLCLSRDESSLVPFAVMFGKTIFISCVFGQNA
jgi:hypothetical protein